MPIELIPDAYGDPRNAIACAMACELAYLRDGAEGASAFQREFGMEAKLISVDNTQVYVAQNDQHVLAAFRGSESPTSLDGLKDWLLTNAVNLLIVPEGRIGTDFIAAGVGARFHKGFMAALADVWDPLIAVVEPAVASGDRLLWVTGHSLGGALAQLAAWRFNRKALQVHQVYTFGAPMVGNKAANDAFDKEFAGHIFRYVHLADLVPRLPTISLIANEYRHCQKEMGVGEGNAQACLSGLAGKMVQGILSASLIDDIWSAMQSRLSAHDIVNYRKLIK